MPDPYEIATWRFEQIAPLVDASLDETQRRAAVRERTRKPVAWIEEATREGVESLEDNRPLYSGLFVPGLSAVELPQAIDCARKGGAAGVSLFSEGAMTQEHYQALKRAL